jgi:hypothetical protein
VGILIAFKAIATAAKTTATATVLDCIFLSGKISIGCLFKTVFNSI